jgi:hypothetical protein
MKYNETGIFVNLPCLLFVGGVMQAGGVFHFVVDHRCDA